MKKNPLDIIKMIEKQGFTLTNTIDTLVSVVLIIIAFSLAIALIPIEEVSAHIIIYWIFSLALFLRGTYMLYKANKNQKDNKKKADEK